MSTPAELRGRFVWHDLMTTDVEAALGFYRQLFPEWEITALEMPDVPDAKYHMISVGGKGLGGVVPLMGPTAEGVPSHWASYVAVDDCEATIKRMEAGGGRCVMPATSVPDVGTFAVVQDSQGAVIKPFQLAGDMELPDRGADAACSWNELITSDMESAVPYYKDAFGWSIREKDMGIIGTYTLFQVNGEDVAGGLTLPPGAGAPPNWLPYFNAEDIDARVATARGAGAMIHLEPQDIPDVGRICMLADPTGAGLALLKYVAPSE